jgi:hypothetical protein
MMLNWPHDSSNAYNMHHVTNLLLLWLMASTQPGKCVY